jgi:hypothetical protein
MDDLRACPFCGGQVKIVRMRPLNIPAVRCDQCGAIISFPGYKTSRYSVAAAEAWNHRPREEALEARVKELELEIAAYDYLEGEEAVGAKEMADEIKRLKDELAQARAGAVWLAKQGAK